MQPPSENQLPQMLTFGVGGARSNKLGLPLEVFSKKDPSNRYSGPSFSISESAM